MGANRRAGIQCASYFFLGFNVGFGSLLGVSHQGFFSILPLAMHLYVPSFCFMHIVSFGRATKAVVATGLKSRRLQSRIWTTPSCLALSVPS